MLCISQKFGNHAFLVSGPQQLGFQHLITNYLFMHKCIFLTVRNTNIDIALPLTI